MLHIANVGDCRAVLCRGGEAVDLSMDHKATREDEVKRIEDADGWVHNHRLNGTLAVSRAFGDASHKDLSTIDQVDMWTGQQLIAKPELRSVQVQAEDEFCLLACDGLWDVSSYFFQNVLCPLAVFLHRTKQNTQLVIADRVPKPG